MMNFRTPHNQMSGFSSTNNDSIYNVSYNVYYTCSILLMKKIIVLGDKLLTEI